MSTIEAQFGVLKRFTLANTDDPKHVPRCRRIYAYLRYRHRKLANLHHPLNRIRPFRLIKLEHHERWGWILPPKGVLLPSSI